MIREMMKKTVKFSFIYIFTVTVKIENDIQWYYIERNEVLK